MEGSVSIDPAHVLSVIQGALSADNAMRCRAEQLLRTWEADAAPGFMASLLQIVQNSQAIDEPTRLLAAVIAKNAVGSSWRKTLGSREWCRVGEEEKEGVRQAAASCMMNDPSERVAVQLSLLIANIAQFDFPGRAPHLLEGLAAAAVWPADLGEPPPPGKLRALKALRRVLISLSTKRFVIEPARGPAGQSGILDLRALSAAIGAERELFRHKLSEVFKPLAALFQSHCQAFLEGAPQWQHHGPAAKVAVRCLAQLAGLTQNSDALPEGCNLLLSQGHSAVASISGGTPAGGGLTNPGLWLDLGGKLVEGVSSLLIAHLDAQPLPFAEYVPLFLPLYVDCALLRAAAASVQAMRAKRRVLLIRFIAKSLLCPYYRAEWVEAPPPPIMSQAQAEQLMANKHRAQVARLALEQLLKEPQAAALTEAVVAKYVALTPEELTEWRDDPEGYARSMDVESGPDADTPRPIGVGLLLCMLERGQEPVAQALIALAARLQASGAAGGLEALLMREAAYRCIGEGYAHVGPHVSFSAWYGNELAPLLSTRAEAAAQGTLAVTDSVLQARALWLVGVCGSELRSSGEWNSALRLVASHLAAQDLVVALTAMSSCLALAAQILEDQAVLETADTASRRAKGSSGIPGLVKALHLNEEQPKDQQSLDDDDDDEEQKSLLELTRQRVDSRVEELSSLVQPALQASFALLARLEEVESMVRVLQLVSVLVEVLGHKIKPHLPIIAAALPQVWQAASQAASNAPKGLAAAAFTPTKSSAGGNSQVGSAGASTSTSGSGIRGEKGDAGAVVRLHSALLAVLTHLVGKLRGAALGDAQVAQVVYPLLDFATNLGSPESECLVDEAFRLWNVTLSSLPEVPPPLISLLPHLASIMRRGRDNTSAFPLLESYLLLGATQSVIPLMPLIQGTLVAAIQSVEAAALASVPPPLLALTPAAAAPLPGAGGVGGAAAAAAAPKPFATEAAAEAMAAAALADVMLQLSPHEVPALLAPTFSAMVHVVAHPALPAQGVNVKVVNMLEGFVEVLGRVFLVQPLAFEALMAAAQQQQQQQGVAPLLPLPGLHQQQQQQQGGGEQQQGGVADTGVSLFVDKWLTVASARFMEELMGVKTIAMLGRYRRRIATAALAALVANRVPSLCSLLLGQPLTLTRVVSLAVAAVMDDADFHTDQADLDALDFKADLGEDSVLAKRLGLTRNDPVRKMNLLDVVRHMLGVLATGCTPRAADGGANGSATAAPTAGVEALLTIVSSHASPRLAERVNALLSNQLGTLFAEDEDDEDDIMARMTGMASDGRYGLDVSD